MLRSEISQLKTEQMKGCYSDLAFIFSFSSLCGWTSNRNVQTASRVPPLGQASKQVYAPWLYDPREHKPIPLPT